MRSRSSRSLWKIMIVLFIFRNLKNTVLAVNNCVEHDDTSYVVLKCVEVEF